jgi:NitT/TauT family transport system permease protein
VTAVNVTSQPSASPASKHLRRRKAIVSGLKVNGVRILIVALVLLGWQYLPQIGWLQRHSPVFDPFFVSSPEKVFHRLYAITFVKHNEISVWPYLGQTLKATFIGVGVGTLAGGLAGLLLSNSPVVSRTLRPFVAILNATPRIALIPIFVIIYGPTLTSSVVTAIAVVAFLVFYNAFEGGLSVSREALQNAKLLGATPFEIMRQVRLPYVLVWTFASLPNAISFGLLSVVTAELLTGTLGMGRLLQQALNTVDATLTFTVAVILMVTGVALVSLSDLVKQRVLHWWTPVRD